MKITIAIPTCSLERFDLLVRTVESIQAGTHKDVHPVIVADGNQPLADIAHKKLHNVSVILNKERIDWIASVNRVFREWESEYYIYAADDISFPSDCIENAMRTMKERFPNGFGVVTLGRKPRCCFGLIGNKLVNRFPDRQVFCPDYKHFCSDTELLHMTKRLNIFAYPPERESQVVHARLKDQTQRLGRQARDKDRATFFERQAKGYMWGINFGRVRGIK